MKNPFVIFDITPMFEMDLSELMHRYRMLVRAHHPDNCQGQTDLAMEDINTAYQILRDPIKRARALLELQGVTVDEEKTLTDPEVLEEMFEVRMANDQNVVVQKQKAVTADFTRTFHLKDSVGMLNAYWRLLYLDKALRESAL